LAKVNIRYLFVTEHDVQKVIYRSMVRASSWKTKHKM